MPLVLLAGTPCSGKTYYAKKLKEFLINKNFFNDISIVSDEEYLEKRGRNVVWKICSAQWLMQQELGKIIRRDLKSDNVIIFDSANIEKSFRYQMSCLAKEKKSSYCVLQCISPINDAKQKNQEREERFRYDEDVMQKLIQRYEDPIPSNKFENPFIYMEKENEEETFEKVFTALQEGKKSNKSTIRAQNTNSDYFYILEKITGLILEDIKKAQALGQINDITVHGTDKKVNLPNVVAFSRLNHVKNSFKNFNNGHKFSEKEIPSCFVDHINLNYRYLGED